MEALPESCLARIFALTSARDVCRMSSTSKTFNEAANSDFVWERLLPDQCPLLLQRADYPAEYSSVASKRDLYFKLCSPVSFDGGKKLFWIDQASGKLCYMLSARGLNICWGEDKRYWQWISNKSSSFKDVAALKQVCWFDVQGKFDCSLLSPDTEYTVSFRLKLQEPHTRNFNPYRDWSVSPAKFKLTVPNKEEQLSARYLPSKDSRRYAAKNYDLVNEGVRITPSRDAEDGWTEYDVGTFVVNKIAADPAALIEFSMFEVEGGHWKSGVLVDGVKIQPLSGRKFQSPVHKAPRFRPIFQVMEGSDHLQIVLEEIEEDYTIWSF